MIFLKFSNYRKDNPFSNTFGKASLALLRDLSPDELVNMDTEQLISFIAQNGNNRIKDVEQMAADLKNLAKRAYRLHPKMHNSINITLAMTFHNIEFFKSQIKRLDKVNAQELQAIPQILTSIPPVSVRSGLPGLLRKSGTYHASVTRLLWPSMSA